MNISPIIGYTWILISFNTAWLCCVLSRNRWPWLVLALTIATPCIGYYAIKQPIEKAYTMVLLVGLGYTIDSLLHNTKLIQFKHGMYRTIAPRWLFVLWCIFSSYYIYTGTALHTLGGWLIPLTAVGFPSSYYIGKKLGAASTPPGHRTWFAIGAIYSIALPCMNHIFLNSA